MTKMGRFLARVCIASFLGFSQWILHSSLYLDDEDSNQGNVLRQTASSSVLCTGYTMMAVTGQETDEDTKVWLKKVYQPGTLMVLTHELQSKILMMLYPVEREALFRTCRFYRAFVMPVFGHIFIMPDDFMKRHLLNMLGRQTGSFSLFTEDQRSLFETLTVAELREAVQSGSYRGTLSRSTPHGQKYHESRSKRIYNPRRWGEENNENRVIILWGQNLRLLPLNPSGIRDITHLHVFTNELRVCPDLSKLLSLTSLDLSENNLRQLPNLSYLSQLQYLGIADNPLDETPDVGSLLMLETLYIRQCGLKTPPNVTRLICLKKLDLECNHLH